MKKTFILTILTLLMIIPIQAIHAAGKPLSRTFLSMGTTPIEIFLYEGGEEGDLDKIEDMFTYYSQLTSSFLRNEVGSTHKYYNLNNVYVINEKAGIEPVVVEKALYDLLKQSVILSEKTNGYFNPAMGRAIDTWKEVLEAHLFQEISKEVYDNTIQKIEALSQADIKKIKFNDDEMSVYLEDDSIKLDLGAYAKGYVTQKAVDYIKSVGITKYMVDAGKSNIAVGKHPDNRPFGIALRDPLELHEGNVIGFVRVNDKHVVTSGNELQYVTYNGKKYHHILSAKDYMPKHYYTSVILIGDDAGLLDAYSTALYSMDEEAVEMFLKDTNIKYILYTDKGVIKGNTSNQLFETSSLLKPDEGVKGRNTIGLFIIIGGVILLFGSMAAYMFLQERKKQSKDTSNDQEPQ